MDPNTLERDRDEDVEEKSDGKQGEKTGEGEALEGKEGDKSDEGAESKGSDETEKAEVQYFTQYAAYEDHATAISSKALQYLPFDFHAKHLLMKHRGSATIEVAAQCGFEERFQRQDEGSTDEECQPCHLANSALSIEGGRYSITSTQN